jgi:hypothetical protein
MLGLVSRSTREAPSPTSRAMIPAAPERFGLRPLARWASEATSLDTPSLSREKAVRRASLP